MNFETVQILTKCVYSLHALIKTHSVAFANKILTCSNAVTNWNLQINVSRSVIPFSDVFEEITSW